MFFCPLFSGSTGNSTFIATSETAILIDAGVTATRLLRNLTDVGATYEDIKGVLITHEHIDHIKGIGVLSRRYNIPIYANSGTWEAILKGNKVGEIPFENRIYFEDNSTFYIGNITISPFETSHDAASSVGYCIEHGNSKIVTATDTGYVPTHIKNIIAGADILMIEFNHDEHMLNKSRYPQFVINRIKSRHGHLSNKDAAKILAYATETGCTKFMLAHLSKDNNTPESAYDAACHQLEKIGLRPSDDLQIEVAPPDKIGKAFII